MAQDYFAVLVQPTSQATAEAGTNNNEPMTPLRTAQLLSGFGLKTTAGVSILAMGRTAAMPSGSSNNLVIIGDLSVQGATSLTDSVFIGTQSGRLAQGGNGNCALGNLTLAEIVTTNHNTTVGDASTRMLQTGQGNSVFGYVAGTELRTGSWNNFIGSYAGAYSERGSFNTFVGGYAGSHSFENNTYNGSYNQGFGFDAQGFAEGNRNISFGYQSLYNCRGDHNIVFGDSAGNTLSQVVRGSGLIISTVTSQTNITVTGGPATTYADVRVVVYDASDSGRPYWGRGDYDHTTGVITLDEALPITITTSDTVDIATIPYGNIHIGRRAGTATGAQKIDARDSISIGNESYCTEDNQIALGGPSNKSVLLTGNMSLAGSINLTTNHVGPVGYPTNGAIWRESGYMFITLDTTGCQFGRNDNGIGIFRLTNDGLCRILTGMLQIDGIPTSAPATAGQIWSDGGTLKITS